MTEVLARDAVVVGGESSPNLQRLIEEITNQAIAEAEEILAQARQEAEKILSEAAEEAEAQAAEIEAHFARAAAETRARIIGKAKRDATKQRLEAMAKVLDDVAKYVCHGLSKMKPQAYVKLMKSLLIQAVQTGDETVSWARGDQEIGKQVVADVITELKRAGKKAALTLGTPLSDEFSGGFILYGDSYEVNATTDVLTEIFFEDKEPEIARILFGEL
ncbi:MAG: hypothetical protein H0Z38_08005 [Firmicutes bacterium]|nr:hypothetical protein [Bacillota bacterium]